MSCGHGWHGCGPRCGPPAAGYWYGHADWCEDMDRPVRRGYRRSGPPDAEVAVENLEARLSTLRDEIQRAEEDLIALRRSPRGSDDT